MTTTGAVGGSAALGYLFAPKSVAIVGASTDRYKLGGQPVYFSKLLGFSGAIYPINPNAKEVQGIPAFGSISAVPHDIECAVIAVPSPAVLGVIEECAAKGVRVAAIFSSNFAEWDEEGQAAQDHIAAIAQAAGMRILGPNCMGALNNENGFIASFNGVFDHFCDEGWPPPGGISIASQSGAVGSNMMSLLRERGLGLAKWVTTGNQSDLDIADCIDYLATDPSTQTILAYLEGCSDGGKLVAAFEHARRVRKPVIMLKVGVSDAGAKAVATHTASIAGSNEIYNAVFQQYGVYRAESMAEALDVAASCRSGRLPNEAAVALVTTSGGVAILMTDAAREVGLALPQLPDTAQRELKAIVPEAATGNPLDVANPGNQDMAIYAKFVDAALGPAGCPAVVAFLSEIGFTGFRFDALLPELIGLRERYPAAIIALVIATTAERRRKLDDAGFLVFDDPTRAVRTIAALAYFARSFDSVSRPSGTVAGTPAILPPGDPNEFEAKAILRQAGLPVPPEELADSAAAAVAAANRIGFPVALKIASPDILHKADIGGVLLGIDDDQAVAAGAEVLLERARHAAPDARIDGVLVSPMIAAGVETVVGMVNDPVFGPTIMFGIGGVFVEVYRDVAFRVAPFSAVEAMAMIREIKGFALLEGVRGAAAADLDAIAETLVRLSKFADANRATIESIDINPLIVAPAGLGAAVADALIVGR